MIANALSRPKESELVDVCLVPFGTWAGHPMGVETYGPEEGAMIVQYFNATYGQNGKPMPLDYNHDSINPNVPSFNKIASGWVWSVEVAEKPDENGTLIPGVWGKVQWTERAAEGIKSGEYSGAISPVIDMGFPDPATGAMIPIGLFNAALTNMPFMLDKMPQASANTRVLTLNSRYMFSRTINEGTNMNPQDILDKVLQAVGMKPGDDPNKLMDFLKKCVDFLKSTEGLEGIVPAVPQEGGGEAVPEAGTPELAMAAMSRLRTAHSALSEVTKLLNCKESDLVVEITKLQQGVDESKFVNKADFDVLKKKLAERDADDLMKANSRKIPVVAREVWKNRALTDLEGTKALLETMPNILPEEPNLQKENKRTANSDEVTQVRKALMMNAKEIEESNKRKEA